MSRTADGNVFADLSRAVTSASENPYDAMIEACSENPKQIQSRYRAHRELRNEQQQTKLLSSEFTGFIIDPVLEKVLDQEVNPGYEDPRNCLVFWARPPQHIRDLVDVIQKELLEVAPSLWLMPLECLHMTVLEVTHSQTEAGISRLVKMMESKILEITDYTYNHRARLVKPMLSYDAAAIAVSFLPAAGEDVDGIYGQKTDSYTYHHLRRDIYALSKDTGVEIASRYVVPSSHLTIARFVTQKDFKDPDTGAMDEQKVQKLVGKLMSINDGLQADHWSTPAGEWQVGEGRGLVCRKGTVWYGGGQSQHEGQGF